MLDFTTQRSIVETFLEANFTTCKIRYENVNIPVKEDQNWISIHDKQAMSQSTGMSEASSVVHGSLIIGIFVPRMTGTKVAREIAQELSDLLGNIELSGIAFQEPEFRGSPGGDPNIPWYQMNLVIPYAGVFGQETSNC